MQRLSPSSLGGLPLLLLVMSLLAEQAVHPKILLESCPTTGMEGQLLEGPVSAVLILQVGNVGKGAKECPVSIELAGFADHGVEGDACGRFCF